VLPLWVATAAVARPSAWRWDILASSTLLVLALHAAGNLLNDYFDYASGADSRSTGDTGRPGRLLVRGEMTLAQVRKEALICLGIAAAAIAHLTWQRGPVVLCFAGAGLAALYAYTGPPFVLKRRAMGEALVFVVFGPALMAGAAYVQSGSLDAAPLLVSLVVGMVPASVLAGNNLRDYEEDASAGVLTLAHLLGLRGQRLVYTGLVMGQVLGAALLGLGGSAPRTWVAAPALLVLLARTIRRVWQGERIPDLDARTARFGAVLMAFLLVALCVQ
jgi:1,4-dihydroxy-2-naphthoate octaprenyltransferase